LHRLILSFFQTFGYSIYVFSSLLIILRMYASIPFFGRLLEEALMGLVPQYRNSEQE
jgi:hypothetical protein